MSAMDHGEGSGYDNLGPFFVCKMEDLHLKYYWWTVQDELGMSFFLLGTRSKSQFIQLAATASVGT